MNIIPKMKKAGIMMINTQLAKTHNTITTTIKTILANKALKFIFKRASRTISSPTSALFSCVLVRFRLLPSPERRFCGPQPFVLF
jgi:hypothetical protein